MTNTPNPQANKTIDEILADFARNLHEYANGRGTGLEFRVESDQAKQAITQHLLDVVERAINDCDDGCNHKDTHKGHSPEWWGAYKLGQNQFQQNIIRELEQ